MEKLKVIFLITFRPLLWKHYFLEYRDFDWNCDFFYSIHSWKTPQTTKYFCQNFSIKNIYISILPPPFWPLKSQRSRNFLLFPQLFWLKKSFLSVSTFDILFGKISTFFKDSTTFIFMWNILQKYTFKYLVIQNILQTTMEK